MNARWNSWKASVVTRCRSLRLPGAFVQPETQPYRCGASTQGRVTQTCGRRHVDSTRTIPNPGYVSLCNRVGHAVRHHCESLRTNQLCGSKSRNSFSLNVALGRTD